VLMTSLCTIFGAIPLLLASGAGAESRSTIGSVIVYGVAFSLLLTLYVVPVVYTFVARNTQSPEYISRAIERLRTKKKEPVAATLTGSRPERPPGGPLSQEDGG
jgi:multidrug efflux pump